jgi:hypothetical protein
MELIESTYYTSKANMHYFSVSQYKAFEQCEAEALAEARGDYLREQTTSMMVGSYVDAYIEGSLDRFTAEHPEIYKRNGDLKADYVKAEEIIRRIESDKLMSDYLTGNKQVIMTAELFGNPWKIKMDVYRPDERIVDLKVVRDFASMYDPDYGGRRSWIEYWGYDLQGAIYQRIEQIATGRSEPLPFYIAAVTKERVPDIAVIRIPQKYLDDAIRAHGVEARIDRFALIKEGQVEPIRCERCDYCKATKVLRAPDVYDPILEE